MTSCRDKATLREVEAIVADVEAIGVRQEELAAKASPAAAEKDEMSRRMEAASDPDGSRGCPRSSTA